MPDPHTRLHRGSPSRQMYIASDVAQAKARGIAVSAPCCEDNSIPGFPCSTRHSTPDPTPWTLPGFPPLPCPALPCPPPTCPIH